MSKMIIPFGTVTKRIVIESDEKGLVRVNACTYQEQFLKGFRPKTVPVPMDAREMVLALIKVIQDYSTVIFASMGEGIINHGETNKANSDSAANGG